MRSTLRSILAAAALFTGLAAATVAVPASPASAAACGDASGVTVVVDPQQLGGGVQEVCDAGGAGKTAAAIFEESGFHQRYAINGGMVCQVNGMPATDCRNDPPANAYWSLWWSDGTTGWTYSSLGVGSLKIPAGGSVAWAWQGQSTKNLPSVAPAKAVAAPSPASQTKATHAAAPKPARTKKSTTQPAKAAGEPATRHAATSTPSAQASTSMTPSAHPSKRAKPAKHAAASTAPTPVASASASASPSAIASADSAVIADDSAPTSADSGDGLPGWVPPAIVVILAVAAGGIAVARRWTR